VEVVDRFFDCPPLNGVFETEMFPQNEPSMFVSHILNPLPGEIVLYFFLL
jgi:16S rRNA C967 or C1407 C5-methylase (RsmB/RsmF family)